MKQLLLFLATLIFSVNALAYEKTPSVREHLPKARFEENKGQWHPNVQFRVELINGAIFYEKDGYTLTFNNASEVYESQHHDGENASNTVKVDVVKAKYIGANSNVFFEKSRKSDYYRNYFIGKDENKWASDVHLYTNMVMPNLYNGIDVRYSSNEKNIKYDVIVKPNADPKQYKVAYEGQKSLSIDVDGNLIIANTLGELKELTPFAYQIINGNKVEVKTNFVISNGNEVSFEFPNGYDLNYELIIDPYLVASTYSGSTGDNWGNTACPGPNGQMRVAGISFATGYPLTAGAYQTTFQGVQDCSISFFNSTGTTLQASTYIGGNNSDNPHSIFSTANGDLYMVGRTESNDFPFVSGCYDGTLGGGSDIFAVRLNSSLTTLIAATYVGGSGIDGANVNTSVNNGTTSYRFRFSYADTHRSQMTIDNTGDVVIASNTQSSDFPVTAGCYDNTLGGFQDGVIIKLDNFLRTNKGATYMGGSTPTGTFTVNYDACQSLQIDAANNIYVAGATNSSDFPTTAGVIHPTALGGVDGFVLKINSGLTTLSASSYLGTTNKDAAFNLDLDKNNNVHVYGLSAGGAYPTTVGTYSNANSCQFIHGLNNSLTSTIYSTKFGNGTIPNISPTAFKVDSCFNIYAVGWGRAYDTPAGSTNSMPTTSGAFQTTTDGQDFYFITLSQNAGSLIYGSFFGQSGGTFDHVDGGTSLFSDGVGEPGVVYQAVCASCGGDATGFPTSPGAYSSSNNSPNCNNAVFKFDLETYAPKPSANFGVVNTCTSTIVTFTNSSITASTYTWNFGDGTPTSTLTSPAHSYTANGTYTVLLTAYNPTTCITTATKALTLAINFTTLDVNVVSGVNPSCASQSVVLQASGANTYTWAPMGTVSSSVMVNPSITTNYTVVGTNTVSGCNKSAVFTLSVNPTPTINPVATPTAICSGATGTLSATGASTYTWNPGSLTGSLVTVSPSSTTIYTVIGTSSLGCTGTKTVNLTVNPSPTVIATSNSSVICSGGSVTLTSSGATSYTWMPGSLTGSVVTVTPASSTNYSVSGSNASGCVSIATVSITVNSLPVIIASSSPTTICVGSTSTLTASGANTYTWNPGNLTGSTVTVSPSSTTIYTVNATDAGGCSGSQTLALTVNNNPTVSAVASPTAICNGNTSTLTASGASTYTWNPGNVTGASIAVTPTVTTIYTVTGTNGAGCVATRTLNLVVNSNPAITALASPTAICAGKTATLTGSGATFYSWASPSGSAGTGATITVTPSITTTYTLNGVNLITSCSSTRTVNVIVNSNPTVAITPSSGTICSTQSITLSGSGASTYTWNPGSVVSSSIVVSPTITTTYTLIGTSSLGCGSNTVTAIVTLNNCPIAVNDATSTPQNTVVVANASTNDINATGGTYTTSQPTAGSGTITMNSTTGQYTFTPNPTFIGTTTATYTLCNGSPVVCSSAIITITVTGTAPVAVTDPISTPQGTTTTGTLAGNDTGANAINSPTYTVTQPSSTTGTITLNPSTGQYTFTPNPTFVGTGSSTYTLCNNTGSCSSTTITYTVTGTAPVAVTDGFSTPQGTLTIGTLAGNDTGANAINSPTYTVTQPSSTTGTFVINTSTGQYTFTPNPTFVGTGSTTYTLCNNTGSCSSTTITYTVTGTAPVAVTDGFSTPQGTLTIGTLAGNDTGANAINSPTYTVTQPSSTTGTITLNPSTGQYTFTPNPTFVGTGSTTYTLCNNTGSCSSTTITYTVTGTAPVAVTDGFSTPQGTLATGTLAGNDTGANAINSPTYTVTQPSSTTGTFVINTSTGQYTFTPNPTFVGTGSTTYTLCNNTGSCSSTTITYTVTGTAPIAVTDPINTPQGTTTTGTLAGNDTGANAINSPTYTVTQPSSTTGTITLNPSTGQYTFTPNPTFVGTGSTTYTLCNNTGSCSSTTITYTVTGTAPIAVTDGFSTQQGTTTTGTLAGNDTGANAINSPTYTVTQPSSTTGTITLNPSTGQYTFTPNPTFVGTGSTTYTLCNNTGSCSSTTITYTVTGTAPIAVTDPISTPQGTTTTGTLAGNDTGANAINSPTYTVTQPSSTTGTITLNPSTGQYTFTPNPNFVGTGSTTYTLCNNTGSCSSTTITYTVTGTAPIAVTDGFSTSQGTVTAGTLAGNDTGANAINSPTYTVTQPSSTTGTFVINPSTGQYTFTPNPTFVGTGSTTYTLCNNTGSCSSTTITYTVTGTAPIAVTDPISTPQGTTTTGTLAGNDTGANAINSPTYTVTQPSSTTGTITLNPSTGQYTFTTNPTFVGTGSTTYTLCNNTGSCSSTTITYTVTGTAPIAVTDPISTPQGTTTTGTLAGNDTGANAINSPTYTVTQPSSTTGTITLNPSTGQYTFTPNPTFVGTGSTTYTLCNNTGSCSSTTITYTVTGTAPVAVTDGFSTPQGTVTAGTLAGNDTGANAINSPTYTVTQPSSTTGTITLNPSTGQYTFTPNPTFVGTGSTTYTLCNNTGSCSSTTINYTVTGTAPIAVTDGFSTPQGTVTAGTLAGNDTGANSINSPTYTVIQPSSTTGTITLNPSTGQYTFTPNPTFVGTGSTTYTLCNNTGSCSSTTITYTVTGEAPVAVGDATTTMQGNSVSGFLSTNDTGDNAINSPTFTVTQPASTTGTININPTTGGYTYLPNGSFTGTFAVTYTLCNNTGNCSSAVLSVTVYPTLVANPDLVATLPNTSTTGSLTANDNGVVSNANYTVSITQPSSTTGTFVINPSTGQYTFTPNPSFNGSVTTTYTICNISVNPKVCSTTIITILVDNPIAIADATVTGVNTPVSGNAGANDLGTGAIYAPISYTVSQPTAGTGTIVMNPSTGQFTYTPATGFTGTTVATYTLCNVLGCSNTTITFTVISALSAVPDATTTVINTPVTGNIGTNDTGNNVSSSPVYTTSQPTAGTGTLIVNPSTGSYTYTPATGFTGTTVATYTLCNVLSPPCVTTTITFTVYPNLVANPDFIPTTPSVTTTGTLTTNDNGVVSNGSYSVSVTPVSSTTGTITVDPATGNYTFVPNPTFTGSTTTTYTICNTSVNPQICSSSTITILVDTPIAIADATTTTENTSVSGNAGANDLGTGAIYAPISYTVGTVTAGTGTIVMNPTTGQYTYTPATGFTGTTVATYTLCNVLDCSTTTITFTVYPNLVANPDFIPTTPSVTTTGTLTTNDNGVVSNGSYSVSVTPVSSATGTITVNPSTGQYTFTPNPTFTGSTTTTYTICNTSVNPQICSSSTITILVDTPIAIADATTTVENTTVSGNAGANDLGTGAIYAPISYTVSQPTTGTGTIVMNPSTGQYTYTPATGFTGTTVATYTLCNVLDCSTTTITFTVYPNLVANPDFIPTTPSVTTSGTLTTNDNGVVSNGSYSVSVTPVSSATGSITVDPATGNYTFVPNPTFTGSVTTTYTICNTSVNPQICSSSTITILVDTPIAIADATTTTENTSVSGNAGANDLGTGVIYAPISYTVSQPTTGTGTIVMNPSTGQYTYTPATGFTGTTVATYTLCNVLDCSSTTITFTVYPNLVANPDFIPTTPSVTTTGTLTTNDNGVVSNGSYSVSVTPVAGTTGTITVDPATGNYTFVPNPTFTGSTTTTYTICNTSVNPQICSSSTITILVDTPIAIADATTTTENTAVSGNAGANDLGTGAIYAPISYTVGTVTAGTGTIVMNPTTGQYTYTPATGFTGTTVATYTLCNVLDCSTTTITFTVYPNLVANPDFIPTTPSVTTTGTLTTNDNGVVSNGSYSVSVTPVSSTTGTITVDPATGNYTFVPNPTFTGSTTTTYTICNTSVNPQICSSSTITILVDTPIAIADATTTTENTSVSGNAGANDLGTGAIYAPISYTVGTVTAGTGTIVMNPTTGQYTYTPATGFTGTTVATYTLCNVLDCSTTTITFTVYPNLVANPDFIPTTPSVTTTGTLTTNDNGVVSNGSYSVSVTPVSSTTGTITIDPATGNYTFVPNPTFTGSTTTTYTICNTSVNPQICSSSTITILVDTPIAIADATVTSINTAVNGDAGANDLGTGAIYAPISYTVSQPTTGTGTIVMNPITGQYTYTPATGFTGTTVATYTLCNNLDCSSTTITFTVFSALNAAPDATTTVIDTPVSGNLGTNDSGVDSGSNPTFTNSQPTAGTGTLVVDPSTGSYTFTPATGFTGTTAATYTLCNLLSPPCSTATITFTVYPNLVANPDLIATLPNTTTAGTLTTNDTGVVPNATYSVCVTQVASTTGTITVNPATGQYTFTPDPAFNGTATTTYTICNTSVNPEICSTSTITIVVDNPIAIADATTTAENTPVSGDAGANDLGTGTLFAPITFTVSQPAAGTGTIVMNGSTGQYTYTPATGFTGTTVATYTLCNSLGCSNTTITFTVYPNLVANPDLVATTPSVTTTGTLTTNDNGVVAGGNYSVTVTPVAGTTGTITVDPSTGSYTFVPNPSFTGTTTTTYTICNTSVNPQICSTSTITILVDNPVAIADATVTSENTPVSGDAGANDLGTGAIFAPISYTVGTVTAGTGTIVMNPTTGQYTFTPATGFTGTTVATYTLCNNLDCSSTTITFTVFPNLVANPDLIATLPGTTTTGSLATNDNGVVAGANYSVTVTPVSTTVGTITIDPATGNYTFVPTTGYTGTTTTTYTICNTSVTPQICSSSTITIVVDNPIAIADATITSESTPVVGDASTNDLGTSTTFAPITYTVGTVTAGTGTITMNGSTGQYTFTPATGFTGTTVASYTLCNSLGCSETTITFTVYPGILAVADATNTLFNTPVSGSLATNDSGVGAGTNPTFTSSQPTAGTGTLVVDPSTGNYTFTPASGFTGTTVATYTLCNLLSPPCSTATITFTVYPELLAQPDLIATLPNTSTTGTITINDIGIVDNATYSVSVTPVSSTTGTLTVDPATGNYTFTPDPSFSGTTTTTYTICNVSLVPENCSSSTITIIVANPVAIADATTTVENTSVTGDASVNDLGTGSTFAPITYTVSQPTAGTGTITMDGSTGQYTFTPATGFTGTTVATYTLCNSLGCSGTTITFTVYPNLVANDDFIPTTPSVTTTGTLTTNDNGVVAGGNYSVTVTPLNPTTGTLTVDPATGGYTFTPNPTFTGTASTTYTICNESVNPAICSSATISILVDNPIAIADATTTAENTPVSGNAGANDLGTGTIYAPISYTVGAVTVGTGTITMDNATGQYTYTPATGFTGTTVVTYTLCNNLDCSSTTITFTVYPNLVANPDLIATLPGTTTTGSLTTNDNGVVSNGTYSVSVTPVSSTTGTITIDPATGNYTFVPNPSFTGTATTTYTICNTSVNPEICSTSTITILVDNPIAIADATTTSENTPVSGDASTNDLGTGTTFAPITYSVGTVTAGTGTLTMDGSTGQYTFTPATGFTGTTVASYTLCNNLGCSETTITFTVYPNLIANPDLVATTPSVTTTGTLTTNDSGVVTGGTYSVSVTQVPTTTGTITINPATGEYTFTPNPSYTGTTTTTYTICNTSVNPEICSSSTITIIVDNPIAINDYTSTVIDTPVSGDASTNDLGTGSTFAPVTYTVSDVTAGTGTITMNPTTGQYTFTPATGFTGTTVATYTLCNNLGCSSASITIVVDPNILANPDLIATTPSVTTTGTLTTNDVATGTNYTVTITQPTTGTGTITIDPSTGSYTFTPDPSYTGTTTTTYTVCNNTGCSSATITIIVDNPIAINDYTSTVINTPVSGDASTNDLGTGSTFAPVTYTVSDVTAGTGTITMNPTTGQYTFTPATGFTGTTVATYTLCNNLGCSSASITIVVDPNILANPDLIATTPSVTTTGTLTTNDVATGTNYTVTITQPTTGTGTITVDPSTGSYTFTPDPSYTGTTTTTYTVCNNTGCSSATITIIVDNPIAINDYTTTTVDTPVSGDASVNDLGTGSTYAPVTYTIGTATSGTITMDPTTGQYTYTPATGFTGTTVATYTLCNNLGCSSASIIIVVTPTSTNVLTANPDLIATTPSVTTTGTLTTNDIGTGTTFTVSVTNPTTGTLTIDPSTGSYTYTPDPSFTGTTTTTYTVCNNTGCSSATITIIVDNPIAINDYTTTAIDTPVSGDASANDLGTGSAYAPVTYTVGTVTVGTGTITMDPTTGQYTYTPATGFTGTTVATYTLCNNLGCSSASITIVVTPTSTNVLTANPDVIITTNTVVATGTLTTNDTGTGTTYTVTVTNPTTGTLTVDPSTGSYTYTPDPTFTGTVATTYTICNNTGCSTTTITIIVNQDLVANPDVIVTTNTAVATGTLTTNDTGTGTTYTVTVTNPTTGTLTVDPSTGSYTYTPDPTFTGTIATTYTICNNTGCSTSTITIIVTPSSTTTVPTTTVVTEETIPRGFSPNEDGTNDTWVIPNIENYPNNVMNILNRWGNVVYKAAGYDNVNVVWNGKATEGVRFGGDDLPEGTYFYILDLGIGEKPLTGYIYLKK